MAATERNAFREPENGHRPLRAEVPAHLLCARRASSFSSASTAIRTMPTDIFPEINIPVVTVIWPYTGLSTPEMEQRVSTYSQYTISSNVNGIKNMESQTLNGLSVQKIYFQPDVNLDLAISQIVSATNAIRALLPPGIQPPIIVQFNASSVPVLQLSLTSDTLNEQQLYDFGIYKSAPAIGAGARRDLPDAGGRQIPADHGRYRPRQVAGQGSHAASTSSMPSTCRTSRCRRAPRRSATRNTPCTPTPRPPRIDELNNIPIKVANGATVFIKDIGHVRDGSAVQQNIVRENGRRAVLLSVIKNGNASTLDVVNGVARR